MIKILKENPDYSIDSQGNVFFKGNLVTDRHIFQQDSRYLILSIPVNGKNKLFKLHRLVANYFIPNPENKPLVNHIDGNILNNDVSNLEWVTHSENVKHAIRTGLLDSNKLKENMRRVQRLSPSSQKGYTHPEFWKPVALVKLDNSLIKEFKSIQDATSYVIQQGWNKYCVVDCLRGHQKTVGPNRDMKFIRR